MSKAYKFWTGVLAFLPAILFALYFVVFFSFFFDMMDLQQAGIEPTGFPREIMSIFLVAFIMAIIGLIAFIFFLIHIINNKSLNDNERLIFILLVIFAHVMVFPVYWYMKIYKTV